MRVSRTVVRILPVPCVQFTRQWVQPGPRQCWLICEKIFFKRGQFSRKNKDCKLKLLLIF